MQSKPKSNSVVTQRILDANDTFDVTITLPRILVYEVRNADGTIFREVRYALDAVFSAHHARACIHGWGQRIPDAAAIGTTDKDGNIIPKAERTRIKAERINELCAHYESGSEAWSRRPTGTERRLLVIEALARVKDETYESAEERMEEYAERKHGGDMKKAMAHMAKAEDVSAAMRAIRAERETPIPGVSADDMLNGE